MRLLEYRLLGPLDVRDGDRPLPLGGKQQRAVLALLLLNVGQAVSVDQLIEALWPKTAPGRPQTAIQGYVSALRKLLGADVIETTAGGYVLRAAAEQLDSRRFERLLGLGREACAAGRPEHSVHRLREALELWRGPVLADFSYEAWAANEIGRLEELRLIVLEELIESRLALGQHGELVGELETLVREQPLRERLRGQLMLALYRAGRQTEALAVFQQTRAALVETIGIDPSPELRALHKQILNQDAALDFDVPPDTPATNLTVQPTRLIGRKQELDEVAALLWRGDTRLLTLTGPGGIGKTRLALQAAANAIEDYSDGVYFVSFAPVSDPGLFVPTIAQTLGVREQPGQPPLETLTDYLRGKSMLLLLDNLEQIPKAAPQIARLLAAADALTVLATSRAPLRLSGERLFPVPPLGLPGPSDVSELGGLIEFEAVRLFVARAESIRPNFIFTNDNAQAITKICLRLEGLPLAIELAAARVAVLSPQAILARLDEPLKLLIGGSRDLDQRQQTLRATIEWSYNLLSQEEQLLFPRLAMFVGGCRLDAAEAVCNPRGDLGMEAFEGMASLAEKSLLIQRDDPDGEPRFWMLETIREYGLERLRQDRALEDAQRRHALFYSAAVEAERTGNPLNVLGRDGDLPGALARVERDLANIRRALDWLRLHQPARIASVIEPLNHYWIIRGSVAEAEPWLDFALAQEELAGTVIHASLLRHRGAFLATKGEFGTAASAFRESVSECRRLGDDVGLSGGLVSLATIAVRSHDLARAIRFLDEARAAAERAGEETNLAQVLLLSAEVEQSSGDSEASAALLRKARDLFEKTGEAEGVADCYEGLAVIAVEASLFDEAEALLASSLSIVRELGHVVLLARCVILYAAIAHGRHDDARAARLLVAADQLLTFAKAPPPPAERRLQERIAAAVPTDTASAVDAHLDVAMNFDEIVMLARPDAP